MVDVHRHDRVPLVWVSRDPRKDLPYLRSVRTVLRASEPLDTSGRVVVTGPEEHDVLPCDRTSSPTPLSDRPPVRYMEV